MQISQIFKGYVSMGYVDYDISWTMPQCVLCLRLIGVAIDVYDGGQALQERSRACADGGALDPGALLSLLLRGRLLRGAAVLHEEVPGLHPGQHRGRRQAVSRALRPEAAGHRLGLHAFPSHRIRSGGCF